MPKFIFSVEGVPDDLGVEYDSIAEAKREAVSYAGRLLCDAADTFWPTATFTMTVADEAGLTLFMLSVTGIDAPVIAIIPKVST